VFSGTLLHLGTERLGHLVCEAAQTRGVFILPVAEQHHGATDPTNRFGVSRSVSAAACRHPLHLQPEPVKSRLFMSDLRLAGSNYFEGPTFEGYCVVVAVDRLAFIDNQAIVKETHCCAPYDR